MNAPSPDARDALPVYSLVCRRDLEMGIVCLRSFVACCRDNVRLIAVSDGSLSPDELQRLAREIPQATLLTRQALAAEIEPDLAAFPHCRAFRAVHAWGAKLIDIPVLARGDLGFIDSDILFVRPFRGLDRRAIGDVDFAYMRSYANIYSLDLPQRLRRRGRPPLVDRCNSGLMFISRRAYCLPVLEEFLADVERHGNILLAEQTGFAALAARCRSGYFSQAQAVFPFFPHGPRVGGGDEAVAVHFVGGSRHLLDGYVAARAQPCAAGASPPATLAVRRSRPLRLHSHLYDTLRHRLYRRQWVREGLIRA
ncbi:MAG TPA: hypothetical protein VMS17_10040 [Gemmataceae bacterium]|nr:hypothetical protein [Gemmataceae bacterium]